MAPLDVRQESDRHTEALDAITTALRLGSYADWDEERRIEFLVRELENPRPLIPPDLNASPEVQDVLDTFPEIARIHPESLGAYVITMTHAASDVLAVELLQKAARVAASAPRGAALRDRRRSSQRRRRPRSAARASTGIAAGFNGRQEVMVGYSDSAKDIGPAQRRLGAVQGPGSASSPPAAVMASASRCFTAAAAASAAAAGPPITRCSRSPPDRSTARCA